MKNEKQKCFDIHHSIFEIHYLQFQTKSKYLLFTRWSLLKYHRPALPRTVVSKTDQPVL